MRNFEGYITEMEERRSREKRERLNTELARRLRERSHEEAVAELYASLTFCIGVSDILTVGEVGRETALI